MNPAVLHDVHEFWFGVLEAPEDPAADKAPMWFRQDDATDALIRDRFGVYLPEAAAASWDNLEDMPRTQQVGLIVLLDQFPRNIFRTSGEAFAYDYRALDLTARLIALGIERYWLAERSFLFLPFMHSEEIAHQDYSVFLYAEQALTAPTNWKESFRTGVDFSTKHRDLIRKFGRFPHRNAVLGRASTPEEIAFMEKHGRGY
ncbi:MAG: DUF924 family protein [Bauldia sp.]